MMVGASIGREYVLSYELYRGIPFHETRDLGSGRTEEIQATILCYETRQAVSAEHLVGFPGRTTTFLLPQINQSVVN